MRNHPPAEIRGYLAGIGRTRVSRFRRLFSRRYRNGMRVAQEDQMREARLDAANKQ